LAEDAALFNEYHALLVRLGKEFCKKSKPKCEDCPLAALD
jgi:endonuclease-3 related protein